MNNRFEVSPNFRIEREQITRNIETMTAKIYELIPERAAFIASILTGGRPEYLMPYVKPSAERTSRTPGQPPCHNGS
jgi:hypothetical protein